MCRSRYWFDDVGVKVISLAVSLLLIAPVWGGDEEGGFGWSKNVRKAWSNGVWEIVVQDKVGLVVYASLDSANNGHQFGFIKKERECSGDVLWMLWGSRDSAVEEFSGKNVYLRLKVNGDSVYTNAIHSVGEEEFPSFYVSAIANRYEGEKLFELLGKGGRDDEVEITLIAPPEWVRVMSTSVSNFKLDGFKEARRRAMFECEEVEKHSL